MLLAKLKRINCPLCTSWLTEKRSEPLIRNLITLSQALEQFEHDYHPICKPALQEDESPYEVLGVSALSAPGLVTHATIN